MASNVEVKLSNGKVNLKEGIDLYCPSNGPGKVVSVEEKEVLGEKLTFCQMEFKKDNVKLSIPVNNMKEMGIRTIISKESANKILETVLDKPAKSSKGVWTKRIQEYETKLYSGSAIFIAEVVRDLFAGLKDPNKSFGERMLFDKAFEYLVQEMSIALRCTVEEANKKISDVLNSNCKVSRISANVEKAEAMDGDFDDNDVDEESDIDDEDNIISCKKIA